MHARSVGTVDLGLLFEGAIICASYSTYWAIIQGGGILCGYWANIRGFLPYKAKRV